MSKSQRDRVNVPIAVTQQLLDNSLTQLQEIAETLKDHGDSYRIPEAVLPSYVYTRRSLTSTISHLQAAITLASNS